jgi:hypothetical protein
MRVKSTLAIAVCLASLTAPAGACVKVRDDKGGITCMKFSQGEQQAAARYGLRLGSPFEIVNQALTKHGWAIDHAWLKKTFVHPEPNMGCGKGYDAVCSTTYIKKSKHLLLQFSGTNDSIPLISVSTNPSNNGEK